LTALSVNRQSNARARALRAPALFCLWRGVRACLERNRRGQQAIEYAVLISAIIAALLFMYMYARRGLQAAIKSSADQIGPQSHNEPLAGVVKTTGNATMSTVTNDLTQVNKIGEETYYDYQSVSTSQGLSETHTQE